MPRLCARLSRSFSARNRSSSLRSWLSIAHPIASERRPSQPTSPDRRARVYRQNLRIGSESATQKVAPLSQARVVLRDVPRIWARSRERRDATSPELGEDLLLEAPIGSVEAVE